MIAHSTGIAESPERRLIGSLSTYLEIYFAYATACGNFHNRTISEIYAEVIKRRS